MSALEKDAWRITFSEVKAAAAFATTSTDYGEYNTDNHYFFHNTEVFMYVLL